MKAEDHISTHPELWEPATRHPFLDAVCEGTMPTGAFDSWLVQDYLFVGDLLVFQSRLLARSPRPAQAVLAAGLVGAEAELGWFEAQAAEKGLDLDTSRHPTTEAYKDLLTRLEDEPYPAAVTALWVVERAYLEAWSSAAPGHEIYREFVEHWTTPEFAAYVTGLEEAADAALFGASGEEEERAESAFTEVARLERDFWEMAWSVDRGSG